MKTEYEELLDMLKTHQKIVFFGGAGVSTESGIPDFRSAHGLYSEAQGRSYEEMLSADYFWQHTDEFWEFYRHVMLYPNAMPNPAHTALADLESKGKLSAILTQNIDGLHQRAGSKNVLELHGSVLRNYCTRCRKFYALEDVLEGDSAPRCTACGSLIKPDVVLYGEPLSETTMEDSVKALRECDLLIVGGTSLVVYPAAGLIRYRSRGTPLVLINQSTTPYDREADLIVRGNIAEVLSETVHSLK